MKRTNISLTESQHKFIKKEAYELGCSLSVVIRGLITDYQLSSKMLVPSEPPKKKSKITLKAVADAIEDVVTESMPLNPSPKSEVNIFKEATKEHIDDRVQFGNKGLFNPAPKPTK